MFHNFFSIRFLPYLFRIYYFRVFLKTFLILGFSLWFNFTDSEFLNSGFFLNIWLLGFFGTNFRVFFNCLILGFLIIIFRLILLYGFRIAQFRVLFFWNSWIGSYQTDQRWILITLTTWWWRVVEKEKRTQCWCHHLVQPTRSDSLKHATCMTEPESWPSRTSLQHQSSSSLRNFCPLHLYPNPLSLNDAFLRLFLSSSCLFM